MSPRTVAALVFVVATAGARAAEACGDDGAGFDAWLEATKKEAIAAGIGERTVTRSLGAVFYDEDVIALDRSQKPFKKSFKAFAAQRITKARIRDGIELMVAHEKTLAAVEAKFGVPPAVVVAIWGLETDYGANMGERSAFRSLATLAYDCRRSARFHGELMSALRIVDRGDLAPNELRGAWAGELGQTQFLPSSYEKFAVDFDGDKKADLRSSVPDVLASTANYLAGNGWVRGAAWKEGAPNFAVLASWNKSAIYQKTIAAFATRLSAAR
jgi:lytic murein transglycosylase